MDNYYEIMGLDWKASKKEIEAAYQTIKSTSSNNKTAKITSLNDAYNTLTDLEKRRAYDVDYYLHFIRTGKSKNISKVASVNQSIVNNPVLKNNEPLPRTASKRNVKNNGKVPKTNKAVSTAPLPKTNRQKPKKTKTVTHAYSPAHTASTTKKKKPLWLWFLPILFFISFLSWNLIKSIQSEKAETKAVKKQVIEPMAYNAASTEKQKNGQNNVPNVAVTETINTDQVDNPSQETITPPNEPVRAVENIVEREQKEREESIVASETDTEEPSAPKKEVVLDGEETPYRKLSDLSFQNSENVRLSNERRPPNGSTPYSTYFEVQGPVDGAKNQLTVKNRDGKDAVVMLVNAESKKIFSHVYIRNKKNHTFKFIPTGTYYLQAYFGTNWNPSKELKGTNFQGGFDRLETFQRYDSKGQLYKMLQDTLGSEIHYAQYESVLGNERRKEETYDHLLKPTTFFKIK